MANYASWDQVVARYPSINRRGGASEVGSLYVDYAEKELESYLAGFFTVPFSNNNMTAIDLAVDLTYLRIGNFKIKERNNFRDEVMKRIQMLQTGETAMITTSGDIMRSDGGAIYSTTQGYTPVFGMGDISNFMVDSDQLLDEENARL